MCMVDNGDGYAEILTVKHVKARKQHYCKECWRVIEPGEIYLYEFGLHDGPFTHKTCRHCEAARDLILDKCKGFVYGDISVDLAEHCRKGIPWAVKAGRYYTGMRRKWKRFFSDSLMEVMA